MPLRHPLKPCRTCPYRKDVKIGFWNQREFIDLVKNEASMLGTVYACHRHAKLSPKRRGMCAGWLLDQKKRGVPSIRLRLLLSTSKIALDAFNKVTSGGLHLYRSYVSMCRANRVLVPRQERKDP